MSTITFAARSVNITPRRGDLEVEVTADVDDILKEIDVSDVANYYSDSLIGEFDLDAVISFFGKDELLDHMGIVATISKDE